MSRVADVIRRVVKGVISRAAGRPRSIPTAAVAPDETLLAAKSIEGNAPQGAALLRQLSVALTGEMPEFARYQLAEQLSTAVYPHYKFSEYGRIFLDDEEFLSFYRRFMDKDNWHSLDRKYTLREMLKLVSHLPGDIAECGAYKGASAYLMCQSLLGSSARVHLFDSFEGLSEPQSRDGDYWSKGSLQTTEQALHQTLVGFDNYVVYKGWIPERFDEVADRRFRFVHVDVDLEQPTRDSLEFFYPRLGAGGIVLLDDHGFRSCPVARAAADEFLSGKPERLALLPTGQAFFIKHPSHD